MFTEIENNEESKNKANSELSSSETLVIATKTFSADEYDQLDIQKGEFLIVTDWNCEDGWVFGHRKNNKNEKGLFPKVFIKICDDAKVTSTSKNIITPEYKMQFEKKVDTFRSRKDMKVKDYNIEIPIRRSNLLYDSFNIIMSLPAWQLKRKLKIKYQGESGIDEGGLLRDFFHQISKEFGKPNYSLFQYINDNSYELEINPFSNIACPNLDLFKYVGRIMGLAIYHKQYLSITFSPLIYKKLLDIKLEFSDLKLVDPDIYKNINWLKNHDGVEELELTFRIDTIDSFGNEKYVELKPNGSNINVTDSNKNEYINLVVDYKLNDTNDQKQLNALKEGFYELIPKDINTIFDENDLKYLISGINEIDVDDWENNTDYEEYDKNDITIINFWKCVRDFNNENRTKLLVFATGHSQVPVTGFKDLQGNGKIEHFKLKRIGDINELPKSHTCFNRIDLPPYTSYTQLKQKLLFAITEGVGSFSVA